MAPEVGPNGGALEFRSGSGISGDQEIRGTEWGVTSALFLVPILPEISWVLFLRDFSKGEGNKRYVFWQQKFLAVDVS